MLGTLLSPELSLGRVQMSCLTLSECYLTARNHMRIDFKDLTFNKFKFSPPFLQLPILKFDWLMQIMKNISLISLLSYYYVTKACCSVGNCGALAPEWRFWKVEWRLKFLGAL